MEEKKREAGKAHYSLVTTNEIQYRTKNRSLPRKVFHSATPKRKEKRINIGKPFKAGKIFVCKGKYFRQELNAK